MCRGFQQNERNRLKVKSFYVHLAVSSQTDYSLSAHDSLTLHYLPRIDGSVLEINGSNIRPDSSAFVTLHRVVSVEKVARLGTRVIVYGSREKVKASEGLRFEIYMGNDVKALKGIFRKDEAKNWKLDCACGLEGDVLQQEQEEEKEEEVKEAEVCVELEGLVSSTIREVVEMVVMKRKRMGRRRWRMGCCIHKLEEIPEQSEVEDESDPPCCCCECRVQEVEFDGVANCQMEDVDGLRWAVDVGIWIVCLGVGYLVTKASSKSLTRRPRFYMMSK